MTKQNIKLTILFILSLPGLPVACLAWLAERYLFDDDLPIEQTMVGTKEHFIAYMMAWTTFFGIIAALIYFLP
jgi:hypothetical protein